MAGENVDTTETELFDLNAGYSDETHAPTETPAVAQVAPVQKVEEPKYVNLKEDEYQKLLKSAEEIDNLKASQQKMMDTVNGRIGRALEEFKGTGVSQVTIDDFPELKNEFPEFAAMQVAGINRALSKRGGGGVDQTKFKEMLQGMLEQVTGSMVDDVLPNWEREVVKPEFATWLSKQDPKTVSMINSTDVRDAAKALRMYADSRKPAKTPEPAVVSTRQKRLDAAAIPKGTGGTQPSRKTDLDDFNAGYNS